MRARKAHHEGTKEEKGTMEEKINHQGRKAPRGLPWRTLVRTHECNEERTARASAQKSHLGVLSWCLDVLVVNPSFCLSSFVSFRAFVPSCRALPSFPGEPHHPSVAGMTPPPVASNVRSPSLGKQRRHDRPRPHHRFRLPGDAVDRAAVARKRRLLRDPSLQQGRRGEPRGLRPQGHHPVGRPGLGDRARLAAHPRRRVDLGPADPRHLLRPAGAVRATRRRGRAGRPARVRPRLGRRRRRLRAVPRRLDQGRARAGVDEPRRPRHQTAARLPLVATSEGAPFAAVADDARRIYAMQFHLEVVHTPHGAAAAEEFHPPRRRGHRRLDHGRLPRPGGQARARPGRQGPGHLRPVGRSRFVGRGRADPRGDRRPAHLRASSITG